MQDFKSSFKLVVSQGLRGITQTIGCVTSLFLISPQMTCVVGVAIPVMITMGTLMGMGLRAWSREAQSQVSHDVCIVSMALCDTRLLWRQQ